ncbi:MAG: transposase [Acidobacteria bacterium]|nr:transposase [Acidobacteriota bacterium]
MIWCREPSGARCERSIERIDIGVTELGYKGGGASSYHPRLLLKVLVYAYLRNIYSSRKIEQALQENVHFGSPATQAGPQHAGGLSVEAAERSS